ncbi:phospholipase D-like domain-containing protein [Sulfuriflexus mobilis]|uniref:phospholipase D-like domain-containing protein n=1 Tax=Sulfuriflexus mobilis TaxID=1811807 RepID=UPI000F82AB71|nr:phosphatidylserine/phosphatidylglycerophosphate/cardiolipin synthase family protein [Sulfuriflexus mobilis]
MTGKKKSMASHFPLREGNQFELLINGKVFLPRMLAAIKAAQESICLEMYLFESGQVATDFIQALSAAVERDVHVRLLLDDFGARGLALRDREQIRHAGIELVFYNPLRWYPLSHWKKNIARDHRKFLLIDAHYGFTGGTGITDAFIERGQAPAWRETMLAIQGPVLLDCQQVFDRLWQQLTGVGPAEQFRDADLARGDVPAQLLVGYGFGGQAIRSSVMRAIGQARRQVWLSTPYFIPVRRLRRALLLAARRGVDVRLLVPGKSDHPAVNLAGQRHYAGLLRKGVKIYVYQPQVLHSKILLCDDWVTMGSSNFDRWTLRWNLEANLAIHSAGFAEQVCRQFITDFEQSRALALSAWQQRNTLTRLQQYFWSKVANWLDRHRWR